MLNDLTKYISLARKKGFGFDQIALRLETSGWNTFLVEHAIKKQKDIEDEKATHWSIWWVVGIFAVVVLVVFGSNRFGWGPSGEVLCVEPGVFGLVQTHDFSRCCSYAKNCEVGDTFTLTDKAGNVVFASNNYCPTPSGDVIIRGDVLARC